MRTGIKRVLALGPVFVGCSIVCLSAESMSPTQAVCAAKSDQELPRNEDAASRYLWTNFAKLPEVAKFRSLTTENWKQTAGAFEAALLQKAEALTLDVTALRKCLKTVSRKCLA